MVITIHTICLIRMQEGCSQIVTIIAGLLCLWESYNLNPRTATTDPSTLTDQLIPRKRMIFALIFLVLVSAADAFTLKPGCSLCHKQQLHSFSSLQSSTEIETENEPPSIPLYLPSSLGVDYIPLATMLATGDFLGADQFTRDNLIKISGAEGKGRAFVYWTEVKSLPKVDLCTMERLWLQFSDGNFGYSIQKRIWVRHFALSFEILSYHTLSYNNHIIIISCKSSTGCRKW